MRRNLAAWPSGRRAKWVVLLVWIAIMIPAFSLAGKLGDVQKNDISAWLPDHAESTQVLERAKKFQPGDTLPAIVVYERAEGLRQSDIDKADADALAFQHIADVTGQVQRPIVADDHKALETVVAVKVTKSGWDGITAVVDQLRATAGQNADGLTNHVTGPGGYSADSGKIFGGASSLMIVTVVAVVLILLFTYRSPLLWKLPVLAAGTALMAAQAVVYLAARYGGVTVNAQTSFILSVLVFGAATDYGLLLIARYREELRHYEDRHQAMAEALRRSGPAILASAATVAVGLSVLFMATLNSTKGLGPVCAIGVLVALVAMVTLMPALLVIFGRWIFWPVRPLHGSVPRAKAGVWTRVATLISSRPRIVWITTAAVLGLLALGLAGLDAKGIPQKYQYTKQTQAVVGEEVLGRHFPAGSGNPLAVVTSAESADQVRLSLSVTPGVASVFLLDTKDGEAFILATVRDAAGTKGSLETAARARAVVHGIPGAHAGLGGGDAITLDMQNSADRDSWVVIPVILIVVFLILALLLRAIVAPLLLIATVVLSFAAALGVSVVVFQHLFHFGGMDASFPLLAFTFLVALGIDYNIFLVTRVREEAQRHGTRRGAVSGLAATGGVITSAGLVLAGTFAALGSLPMVFSAELGFTVAVGVLLDTIVVRAVLVTALTLDLGRWMWWPSRLFERPDEREPTAAEPSREPALMGA